MKMLIVAVKDGAIDAFGRPIFVAALGQATRSFSDEVNNEASDMFKHPADYVLYHIGEYDDANASFTGCEPRMLARGADVSKVNVDKAGNPPYSFNDKVRLAS